MRQFSLLGAAVLGGILLLASTSLVHADAARQQLLVERREVYDRVIDAVHHALMTCGVFREQAKGMCNSGATADLDTTACKAARQAENEARDAFMRIKDKTQEIRTKGEEQAELDHLGCRSVAFSTRNHISTTCTEDHKTIWPNPNAFWCKTNCKAECKAETTKQ